MNKVLISFLTIARLILVLNLFPIFHGCGDDVGVKNVKGYPISYSTNYPHAKKLNTLSEKAPLLIVANCVILTGIILLLLWKVPLYAAALLETKLAVAILLVELFSGANWISMFVLIPYAMVADVFLSVCIRNEEFLNSILSIIPPFIHTIPIVLYVVFTSKQKRSVVDNEECKTPHSTNFSWVAGTILGNLFIFFQVKNLLSEL